MTADTSFDPRTGSALETVDPTTPAELEAVVRIAAEAADVLAASSPQLRRDWLNAAADVLESNLDELVELADRETALGTTRLSGEVDRTIGQIRFYADAAAEGSYLGAVVEDGFARTREPLGPVAVFGASNFPFAYSVLGTDTAAAIAAGCSVVVKAHPAHPLVSQRVFELTSAALTKAGAPVGTLGLLVGYDAGVDLVMHPAISAVAFTGSQNGGMSLWRLANEREIVIPVFAEMGTVNPVVVTPAAAQDIEKIASGFIGSFTLSNGQFCTKPGLLFAPRGVDAPGIVARLLDEAAPEPVMLTRGIAASVTAGIDELLAAGATVVTRTSPLTQGWAAPAAVLSAPLSAIAKGSRLLEECFGPVVVVVEYDSVVELSSTIDLMQGALAGSLMIGQDDTDAAVLLDRLRRRVGRVIVNDWPTGVRYNTWGQQHGGPWPATTQPATTSVGAAALERFLRPVTYQGVPDHLLPPPLQAANPWRIARRVDGVLQAPATP